MVCPMLALPSAKAARSTIVFRYCAIVRRRSDATGGFARGVARERRIGRRDRPARARPGRVAGPGPDGVAGTAPGGVARARAGRVAGAGPGAIARPRPSPLPRHPRPMRPALPHTPAGEDRQGERGPGPHPTQRKVCRGSAHPGSTTPGLSQTVQPARGKSPRPFEEPHACGGNAGPPRGSRGGKFRCCAGSLRRHRHLRSRGR